VPLGDFRDRLLFYVEYDRMTRRCVPRAACCQLVPGNSKDSANIQRNRREGY